MHYFVCIGGVYRKVVERLKRRKVKVVEASRRLKRRKKGKWLTVDKGRNISKVILS